MKTKRLSTFSLLLVLLVSCDIIPLPPKVTPDKGLVIDNRRFSLSAQGGSVVATFTGYNVWVILGCTEYLYVDNIWKDIGSTYDEGMGITLSDNKCMLSGSWYSAYKPEDKDGQYANELLISVSKNDTGIQRRVLIYLGDGPNTDSITVTQEAN